MAMIFFQGKSDSNKKAYLTRDRHNIPAVNSLQIVHVKSSDWKWRIMQKAAKLETAGYTVSLDTAKVDRLCERCNDTAQYLATQELWSGFGPFVHVCANHAKEYSERDYEVYTLD